MHKIVCNVSTGEIVQIPYTTEEQAEYDTKKATWDAGENNRKAAEVRAERSIKLAQTDWIVIKNLELNANIPGAWEVYRQALRDIPAQAGFPWTITWPDAP